MNPAASAGPGSPVPRPGADQALITPHSVRYAQAILWAQGLLDLFYAVLALATVAPGLSSQPNVIGVILATALAGAGGVTALRLRRGRRLAVLAAIALEILWAMVAIAGLARGPLSTGFGGFVLYTLYLVGSVVASGCLLNRKARRFFAGPAATPAAT